MLEVDEVVFPGIPGVKNLPANEEDTGLIPGPGRFHIPYSNQACEPPLLKPTHPRAGAPQQKKTPQWEAHTPQLESRAWFLQLEKSPHRNKDPAQPQIKK